MGFTASDLRLICLAVLGTFAAGFTDFTGIGGTVVPFIICAVALALLASLVGKSVEALGDRLGAGATGVLQSALGNLPELFVVLFALKSKLYDVATASLVGSILANLLLILGLAFVVGGRKHGVQRFGQSRVRHMSTLLVLAIGALLVPSLTATLHTPAAGHERALSVVVAVLLLLLFVAQLPASLQRAKGEAGQPAQDGEAAADGGEATHGGKAAQEGDAEPAPAHDGPHWPLGVAIGMLALAALGAAAVSDWFVEALQPAMDQLGISQAFAGLVIVAIAGNAVENVVGIQLAAKNQADYAVSIILQSPLQICLVVAPALVLLSPLVGASFTLVLSPLLIAVLIMAVVITIMVVLDGESNWLEGVTLIVLYGIIAAAFWWG